MSCKNKEELCRSGKHLKITEICTEFGLLTQQTLHKESENAFYFHLFEVIFETVGLLL